MSKKSSKSKRDNAPKLPMMSAKELDAFLGTAMAKNQKPVNDEVAPIITDEEIRKIGHAPDAQFDFDGTEAQKAEALTTARKTAMASVEELLSLEENAEPVYPAVVDALAVWAENHGTGLSSLTPELIELLGAEFRRSYSSPINAWYERLTRGWASRLEIGTANFDYFLEQRYGSGPAAPLDESRVEKLLRRLDSEVRAMIPADREEVMHDFLELAFLDPGDRGGDWRFAKAELNLSNVGRSTMQNLAQFYRATVAIQRYRNGRATRRLNDLSVHHWRRLSVRSGSGGLEMIAYCREGSIKEQALDFVEDLSHALLDALPYRFGSIVKEVLVEQFNLQNTQYSHEINDNLRTVRSALISLARGSGSFESFFTLLRVLHKQLTDDITRAVAFAHYLIQFYNNLGLDIAEVLEHSAGRIGE